MSVPLPSNRPGALVLAVLLTSLLTAIPSGAQEPAARPERRGITLEEAIQEARRGNADLGLSEARERMAAAEAGLARAALLPNASVSSAWTRTTDPVATFGTKLRQGRFGQSDFALEALNDPYPVEDWESRASLGWEPVVPARWARRSAAEHASRASGWTRTRTRQATDYRTRLYYYEALRTADRVEAARAAVDAAEAVLEQFRRREEQGLVTRADVLQARAELDAARAGAAGARQGEREAAVALAVHLGWSPDERLPRPLDELTPPSGPGAGPVRAGGEAAGVRQRSDLMAAEEGVRAAEAEVEAARLAFLPALGAFATWANHGTAPFSGDGTDWTVGVGLRWSLFEGLGRNAELESARAGLTAARLERERAVRSARGELLLARRALRAAGEAFEAARSAREAARTGRDLMRRRFAEGLATPADLLQAEARTRTTETGAVDALARYHQARARLRFATAAPTGEGER